MSHTSTADINARKIECEELLKNAESLISKFNLSSKTIERIEQEFHLSEIRAQLSKPVEVSVENYNNILNQSARLNQFISNIETYLVLNLDIKANEYNERVSQYIGTFIENDQSILEEALQGVDSNIKKKYILSRFNSKRYNSKDTLLADVEEDLKNSKLYKKEQISKNLEELAKVKNIKISENDDINESIVKANQESANEEVSINVRNRVVTAIIKIIKEQGFIVKRENVVVQGEEAVIFASKTNGEEARFKINLNGKFAYKFHKYSGMSCEKDINNFEKMFKEVYGINIENKNIIWSNPDRLDKMAHQALNNNKIGG